MARVDADRITGKLLANLYNGTRRCTEQFLLRFLQATSRV
jgi:hypothetical protein